MTILAQDTMIRANQSGLGTASDGHAWTFVPSSSETTSIASNEAVFTGFSSTYAFALIGSGTATTINILCRMAGSYNQGLPGLTFRYTDANNNYFVGFYAQQVYIDKYVSGTRSQIAVSGVLSTWAINDYWWVRVVAVGSSINCYAWKDGTSEPGTATVSGTDSSFATGQYGLVSQTFSNTTNSFDHLTVTDNQSSPTTVTKSLTVRTLVRTQATKTAVVRALVRTQQAKNAVARLLVRSQITKTVTLRVRTPPNNQKTLSVGLRTVVSLPATPSISVTWITRDMTTTWTTRDMAATWGTRG